MAKMSAFKALLLIICGSAIGGWQVEVDAFSSTSFIAKASRLTTTHQHSSSASAFHRHVLQNKFQTNIIQDSTNYYSKKRVSSSCLNEGLSNNDNLNTSDNQTALSPTSCWNPNIRKIIATISSIGILETAYLTYDKIQYSKLGGVGGGASLVSAFCSSTEQGSGGSCNDVLHGPYASLHLGTIDIPLSLLGMAAYTMVFALAIIPLLFNESDVDNDDDVATVASAAVVVPDAQNRIALLGSTTLMASFSVYLVSLLIGVLHTSCLFCFFSAGLSISMAGVSWIGGMLPGSSNDEVQDGMDMNIVADIAKLRKNGMVAGASSVGLATVMALVIFVTVDDGSSSITPPAASTSSSGTLLASTSSKAATTSQYQENVPPPITTTSSKAALSLAKDLNSLDSRMFGAFWCSHCYDQKQALGYEAMQSIPYIECDREGFNNKRDFCKEKDVPGYPTWEIGGSLFPGERSLEELKEIVDDVKSSR
ncbi:hypothetical protein ACHAWC_004975 [Mediolabrus comicus]